MSGHIDRWADQKGPAGIAARYAKTLEIAIGERNVKISKLREQLQECRDALYEDPENNWISLVCEIQKTLDETSSTEWCLREEMSVKPITPWRRA